MIIELKADDTADNAINQIREKEYLKKFINENKNSRVLLVAICYNSKMKDHQCKIEEL